MPTATKTTKPNVLYLHSHDTGRYVQPYGHAIPTPAYQRLAEEGVLFRQNFCIGPTCSPSRAALLTGQTPHSCGQLGLAHRGFELEHPERHLAWTLRNNGYIATLVGVQHVVRNDPGKTGYEHVPELKTRKAEHVLPAALKVLSEHAAGPRTQPFYLDVGFIETHRVFHQVDRSKSGAEDARYGMPPAVLPDTPETRQDMADFKASARVLDDAMGKILDALDEHGMSENTLVVLTTDHGIAFPHMKCNLTDHGTGVLLIVRGPASAAALRGGKVVDALVTHLDVYPTVCDVTGIEHPDWLQGKSLIPLASGEVERLHDEIFGEVNYHAAYEPQRSVRTDRWRYIRRYDSVGKPILANCDDGLSKEVWMRHGWPEQDTVQEQLYDVMFDPQERHNLADDARHAETLEQMKGRLERWMRATTDPLLKGDVPMPDGARANAQSDVTPRGL